MFGPLSIPPTTPPGTPTVPPGMPPVTPPSSPGLPGSTTACGAAGGLQIAGSLFNAGSECRARNQALSACEKTAHSVSGSCSCCVATLNRIQNGPGTYYYTGGFGYVANKPCSQVASGSGLSQAGSVTEYNPW